MNRHKNLAALIILGLSAVTLLACATSPATSRRALPSPSSVPAANDAPLPESTPTPPVPVKQVIAPDLLALQQDLAEAIEGYWSGGKYAVAVTDLQTGEMVSVNGSKPQLSGCVMNLFVILQVARDLEAGRYELGRAEKLIAATTWSSNAATARELYVLVGGGDATNGVERVDELIREVLGLEDILIDHPPLYHADSIGRDYNNWVTAEAVNEALAALWNGELLTPEWRDFVLGHLAEVKPGLNYLTAAVPEGIVSHKNGFLLADTGYVDNDAGIVRLERGGREYAYAVTFLSEQVPSKYGDVGLGQQISKLAYDVMAARYP